MTSSVERSFPPVTLADREGRQVALAAGWTEGPALILVGHRDCKTTRETLPIVDRIHRRRGKDTSVVAVLQDDAGTASALASQLGLLLPILLDPDPFLLARALSLEVVPALYLVERGGAIAALSEGFRRADLERFATRLGVDDALFGADERVSVFRPG
jgi:hypothetical protein